MEKVHKSTLIQNMCTNMQLFAKTSKNAKYCTKKFENVYKQTLPIEHKLAQL